MEENQPQTEQVTATVTDPAGIALAAEQQKKKAAVERVPQEIKDEILAPVQKRIDNIVARLKAHGIHTEEQ